MFPGPAVAVYFCEEMRFYHEVPVPFVAHGVEKQFGHLVEMAVITEILPCAFCWSRERKSDIYQ